MAQQTSNFSTESTLYSVTPLPGGRWQVSQEGGASTLYDDKETAVTAAVELARLGKPGTVRVRGLDGTIESERVVGVR